MPISLRIPPDKEKRNLGFNRFTSAVPLLSQSLEEIN